MTTIPAGAKPLRRTVLAGSLAGGVAAMAHSGRAAPRTFHFDRPAYERYVGLMNAGDLRFCDYYADDIKFVMGMRGKAAVRAFYDRHRPYVKERVDVLFFCSDATGAAAELRGEMRCIEDCDDETIFGRPLKMGEVQRTHGYLLYVLNAEGKVAEIRAPPPEIVQAWRLEPL